MAHRESPSKDELVLIPAIRKDSTTGYKCVNYNRGAKKFEAKVMDGGKRIFIGQFDTAEEAAIAYARSEYGRADAAKMKQTRPAPSAVGAAAVRQAEKEGLTLATSANKSGYKGVFNNPKEHGSNKFTLQVRDGGKLVNLGRFATPEQAALFYARRRAGRDTTDLTAPPPPAPPPAPSSAAGAEAVRQAGREGLTLVTSCNSNSGYKDVSRRASRKYKLHVWEGGKDVHLGVFGTAEEAALARARYNMLPPEQASPRARALGGVLEGGRRDSSRCRDGFGAGGAAGPSGAGCEEEEGLDPADVMAGAVALSLLADRPPSSPSGQRATKRHARGAATPRAAAAAAAAAAGAAPPSDDEAEAEAHGRAVAAQGGGAKKRNRAAAQAST